MLKLKQIIAQLPESEFEKITDTFKKTKADNYYTLIKAYRDGKLPDAEIINALDISSNSFYVLKSRLLNKIQDQLSVDVFTTQENLIKQLLQVPEVCFNMPRETAITFLNKLEKELVKFDLHNDLLVVYSALKKMHLYSEKYFYYSQLFNKHTALGLSLEKAEEILGNFNRILGQYSFSRNQQHLDTLYFLKNEIDNLFKLNQSRQIEIIKYLVELQLTIFCEENKGTGLPTADIIQNAKKAFSELPESSAHKKWEIVLDFLSFEYYVSIEEYKAALSFYEKVNENISCILLYNNISLTSRFLSSKIKFCCQTNRMEDLAENPKNINLLYDTEDGHAKVLIAIYNAMLYFKQKNYKEAINSLNNILNTFSFKDFFHESITVKLTLAYFYLIQKEFDLVEITLKSVSRKIKSEQLEKYYYVLHLIKIFESEMNSTDNAKVTSKNKDLFILFTANNKKGNEVLYHLMPELKNKYQS
jgi:tetratricopeptide (TPR) repeat protein